MSMDQLEELIQTSQDILKPLEEVLEELDEKLYDKIRNTLERLEDITNTISSCNEEDLDRMDGLVSRIQKNINKLQEKSDIDLEVFEDSIENIEDLLKNIGKSLDKKPLTIIVNGQEKTVSKKQIFWEELVQLAYPGQSTQGTIVYTITYTEGPKQNPEGTLNQGESVKITCDMEFDVERTDKS